MDEEGPEVLEEPEEDEGETPCGRLPSPTTVATKQTEEGEEE